MRADGERLAARIIHASLINPTLVVLFAGLLIVAGLLALKDTPVEALPDIGDVQVIVRTPFAGQAPQIVEDQVTFPLTTSLRSVPGATAVRGYSFFGDSFVYVLFEDGTDPYWARSRILESIARARDSLPAAVQPVLGPDGTGAGWIFEYALVDRTGRNDIMTLRSLQDWWLKLRLQSIDGVAEVSSIGGMVREYQVVADPNRMRAYGVDLRQIRDAIVSGNREAGGSVIEMAEADYMVRASGYIRSLQDLRAIALHAGNPGAAVTIGDVAEVRLGPQSRRGIAELDGQGEVVGGVVILRSGANPQTTLADIKARIAQLRPALPAGVEIIPTYDRSRVTSAAIQNLTWKLAEEFVAVLLVCVIFLRHARSALIVILFLVLGVLTALLVMRIQHIEANIMSLAGIAIALGTMVDAAIVMIENVHKRLEGRSSRAGPAAAAEQLAVIAGACNEVGPTLVFSLLIIALSFLPVLALEAQEGRLFAPLAYTKTYTMLAGALLSITVVPVAIRGLLTGPLRREHDSRLSRGLARAYRPVLDLALRWPGMVCAVALASILLSLWPMFRLGTEFMPDMYEGDLLFMPVTAPGISADAARSLLQRTDARIREIPEVAQVFGKAGRADSATDPAPLEMFETVVRLKPRSLWRPGLTLEGLERQLAAAVELPALSSAWLPPIRARIDMANTGVRTPLGLRISGPDPAEIETIAARVARLLEGVPGAGSVYAERVASGRYVDIEIDREAAARFGLDIATIHDAIRYGVGGEAVTQTAVGRERYPISVRYPAGWRDSAEQLRKLPIVTQQGLQIELAEVARVSIVSAPAVIRSEDAVPTGWVYVGSVGGGVGEFVREAEKRIAAGHAVPAGYSLHWSGQFEYLRRAFGRLQWIVPGVLAAIVLLLWLNFRRWLDVGLVLVSLPFALVGAMWFLWILGYSLSVAVAVGIICLGAVATETGMIMVLFLNGAWQRRCAVVATPSRTDLLHAIVEGALLRLRPKLMTVAAILAGLIPMLLGSGIGSEVLRRVAAPMVGGVASATVLTLLVIPSLFYLAHRGELPEANDASQSVDLG